MGSVRARASFAALAAMACLCSFSCVRGRQAARPAWLGKYLEASGPGESALSVDFVGKSDFAFSLILFKDNGQRLDVSGTASCRGTSASYSGKDAQLDFAFRNDGSDEGITVSEGGSKPLSGSGFRTDLRFAREGQVKRETGGPAPSAATAGAFLFGYYIPSGTEKDSLPESLNLLFFNQKGNVLTQILLFEGSLSEGRDIGTFRIENGAVIVSGKARKSAWKMDGDAVISDSGDRYVFWKASLDSQ